MTQAEIAQQRDITRSNGLSEVKHLVRSCIQCGTCTGSCPNAFAMDHTPRQLWRMALMDRKDEIFQSRTFSLCSSCYSCRLRCPRGLPLTEAMHRLKQIAIRENNRRYKQTTDFYKFFVKSILKHGRVRETGVMTRYLISRETKDPFALLKFASLGLRLFSKGKVGLQLSSKGDLPLMKMFQKVRELEEAK